MYDKSFSGRHVTNDGVTWHGPTATTVIDDETLATFNRDGTALMNINRLVCGVFYGKQALSDDVCHEIADANVSK